MTWKQARNVVTRNWKEKALAMVLALLFWFMIKAQVHRPRGYYGGEGPPRVMIE